MNFEYYPETLMDWLAVFNQLSHNPAQIAKVKPLLNEISSTQIPFQLGLRLSDPVLLAIVFEIMDDQQLEQLLSERTNHEVRLEIVKHIDDHQLKLDLYHQEQDTKVRLALLKSVLNQISSSEDPKYLSLDVVSLFREEGDPLIRAELLKFLDPIKNRDLLEQTVFGDEHIEPRAVAASLISDQEVLKSILSKEQNGTVRLAAVTNLEDDSLLRKLVETDLFWKIRRVALEKINDESVLVKAATSDPSMEIRLFAIEHIEDLATISYISMNEHNPVLRQKAVELIIDKQDHDTLLVIALEEKNPEIKSLVIPHITHQQILFDIARNTDSSAIIELVIQQLTDHDILLQLFDLIKSLNLQKLLILRLIDLGADSQLAILKDRTIGSIQALIQAYHEGDDTQ